MKWTPWRNSEPRGSVSGAGEGEPVGADGSLGGAELGVTTTHQPVPIHLFTRENVARFFMFLWLVNRALWPAWAVLAVCAVVKIAVMQVKRSR